ncbi:hypothetical protein LZ023_14495 [Pseudomonas silvicola]|nr:hypothetical protein LZ023_14495 [Pseudomonas silvicola]
MVFIVEFPDSEFRRELNSFQRLLLARAAQTIWPIRVKAYLTDVRVHGQILLGVNWGNHAAKSANGHFANGHLIHTSNVMGANRVGKHWFIQTLNSYYVVVHFAKGGRAEFAERRKSFVKQRITNPLATH